jgi:catechol 2,3-dioxygenase-like lactoylglutathione lyase family enzyme
MISKTGSIDVGVIVTDLEPMRSFYRDVLELEEASQRETEWGTIVDLAFGTGFVRLVRLPGPPSPAGPVGLESQRGIRTISLAVEGFDAAVERCKTAGTPFELDVTVSGDARIALVRDPEGNIIELVGANS